MATTHWPDDAIVPPLHQRDGTAHPAVEIAALLQLLRNQVPATIAGSMQDPRPAQPWRRAALPLPLQDKFAALRERCTDRALDAWMAVLLRAWLHDIGSGTARKIRWVVPAVAILGGDACAALLGPHLRGENYDLRCTGEVGVDALVDIGTRGALLELAHIARKCAKRMRGQAAEKALLSIAATRGLTPDQLQDRILPDCGLDAMGRRSFDYGPRQFDLLLDDTLTAVLRSADGKRITSLPKPNSKDAADRADDARTQWKVAKVQIAQSARWLAGRFETAMITGESWTWADFEQCFRRHPLARHVVSRLLWTSVGTDAPVCFRVAEDGTLADSNDATLDLSGDDIRVRPVHPLELERSQREAWQRVFADYQIVSPFQQLDRQVFRAAPNEAQLQALTTFPHAQYQAAAVVFPLESRGWDRHMEGGTLFLHVRSFPTLGIAAWLNYEPGAFIYAISESDLQRLTQLQFLVAGRDPHRHDALRLGDVPPIVFSEVLRDIHALLPHN